MGFSNSEILELVSKTKFSIKNIKNTTREDINKIKKLGEEITKIAMQLENNLKDEERNLVLYKEELTKIKDEESDKNIATIIRIITSNLPKDIKFYESDENSCIKLYPVSTNIKDIEQGNESDLLGEIKIEAKEDIFVIKVKILGNSSSCKFCLKKTDPLRIYKIISYLNDFLSYDE